MAAIRKYTRELPYQPMPTYRDHNANIALKLDLNALYIKRPKETFFVQVKNPNLLAWGIEYGDLLIVENTDNYMPQDMLVLEQNGEYRFYQYFSEIDGEKFLVALDAKMPNLRLQSWQEIRIAGVITNVVHQMRNRAPLSEKRYAV